MDQAVSEPNAVIKFAKPDDVELTLTVTLPLSAWKQIRRSNPPDYRFLTAINDLLDRAQLEIEGEIKT